MEMQPPAQSVGDVPEDDETAPYDHSGDPFLKGDETVDYEGDGEALTTTSSRFWGVGPRRPPPHEPGRRRATGAPRAQGKRPRAAAEVAEAPPRRARRRAVVARPSPPLGIRKRIYITRTPQKKNQTYFFASSYNTSTSADAIARTLFAMPPAAGPPGFDTDKNV